MNIIAKVEEIKAFTTRIVPEEIVARMEDVKAFTTRIVPEEIKARVEKEKIMNIQIKEAVVLTIPVTWEFKKEEIVEGIDGIRKVFSTSHPFISGTLIVSLNGQIRGDTKELPHNQFEMSEAPLVSDSIYVFYFKKK